MRGISLGQILLVVALAVFLIMTGMWAVSAWNSAGDVAMSKHGMIALGLGIFFSLIIGCGLMALMFYSSRSGYDEAADPFRDRTPPPKQDGRPG